MTWLKCFRRAWRQARAESQLPESLISALNQFTELVNTHRTVGERLYASTNGSMFPCDGFAFAALDRSLNLTEGFSLLMRNHGFMCAAALLRMQLDSLIRLYGVITAPDPHGTAEALFGGTPLATFKDRSGELMTDRSLINRLTVKNPDIGPIYGQASGYVHFSEQNVLHFLARSKLNEAGQRLFAIGNNDDHIPIENRVAVVNNFSKVTKGIFQLINDWIEVRHCCGTTDELKERFSAPR
jgi:hypothetical protein